MSGEVCKKGGDLDEEVADEDVEVLLGRKIDVDIRNE